MTMQGQRLAQKQGQAQLPKLTSRILTLGTQELAAEIRLQAEQNPALEYEEASLPLVKKPQLTLAEHLAQQLETTPMPKTVRADALLCITEMDGRGYLPDANALAGAVGVSSSRAKSALSAIRSLSPTGVGANNLADRLLMQLDEIGDGPGVKSARELVSLHFKALSHKRRDLLPQKGLGDALCVLDRLRPDITNDFAQPADFLEPDLEAKRVGGHWQVSLLDRPCGVRLAALPATKRRTGTWAAKHREARALVGAVEFRRKTLLAVAQALVDRQRPYLEHGKASLRPATLRDLAADTGFSVSTVAAATKGKSIVSPAGTVALKYLLQRKATGGKHKLSAAALQEAIKSVVSKEEPAKPLTDEKIVQHLVSAGLETSRRTVAKHRARAGILPSGLRRIHG